MSQLEEVYTDGSEATFLAVFAGKYYEADLAVWRFKTALGDGNPSPREKAQLEHLRGERRATYFDLIGQSHIAEASRRGIK